MCNNSRRSPVVMGEKRLASALLSVLLQLAVQVVGEEYATKQPFAISKKRKLSQ